MKDPGRDRFGLLMRPAIAREMRHQLERIEIVQVISDDWIGAPTPWLLALRGVAQEVPLHLHGVGLGLASTTTVGTDRLDQVARLVECVRPERWSEHLAFVRGGGIEIGHLAAPPRTGWTLEGAVRNTLRARDIVGALPELENVATLIDPPGSELSETAWIESVVSASGASLLLDLHNLYCNAVNFGFDPVGSLGELPLHRVSTVHVAGGRLVATQSGGERRLDDHAHPVPSQVHALLYEFGRRTSHPVDVILEREARVPPLDVLLDELDGVRATLAMGRARSRSEAAQ